MLVSGVVQSVIEVNRFGALLDTPFGRSVLIKVIVALAIVALGSINLRRVVPALKRATGAPGRAGVLLRRTLRLESRQIAPIELTASVAGPGHYVVTGAALSVAGDWTIKLVNRVTDFDEYVGAFSVPIE